MLKDALRVGNALVLALIAKTNGMTRFNAKTAEEIAYKSVIDWFLKSAIATHSSILILCDRQLDEDAVALARTIFEKELAVEYLALRPKERMREFDRSALLRAEDFRGKLEKQLPHDPLLHEIDNSPACKAAQAARKAKPTAAQWPSRATMANKLDEEKKTDEYRSWYRVEYAMMCDVSHSDPNTINLLLEFEPGKVSVSADWRLFLCSLISGVIPRFINLVETATRALGLDLKEEITTARCQLAQIYANNNEEGNVGEG